MKHSQIPFLALLGVIVSVSFSRADGPADNIPANVRPVPPPGIQVADNDRTELQAGVQQLGQQIEQLRTSLADKPALLALLPDVQIYHNAVRYALQYNEFYRPQELTIARDQLRKGMERANPLAAGQTPWTTQTGLVARGYLSKIDGSVQPYGLVVPASFKPDATKPFRLDTWFHGRGEQLTELAFIADRERNPGQFTPADTFVLHLYGRYCNANKLAGEVDLFEALDAVKKAYPIDEERLVNRGFSMGGAASWHFAVHFPHMWAAAAPGAGFSETPQFLRVFQNEKVQPTWYEQKLWHIYDCNDWAVNLSSLPVIAYSGENDSQKQAADVMEKAMAEEGLKLTHVIGPKTGHSYHPEAKVEINRQVDAAAAAGRNVVPRQVRMTTWTLKYPRAYWVTVDGLGRHWERARVDAEILDANNLSVKTQNVTAFTLSFPASDGRTPSSPAASATVMIDGSPVKAKVVTSRHWTAHFRKSGTRWTAVKSRDEKSLAKRHNLQGPIDDAFMDSFIFVRPTGTAMVPGISKWVDSELQHATTHWRSQFRGEARLKDDTQITDADVANSNLVLWGDPGSNQVLARIIKKLPVRWTAKTLTVGKESFPAETNAPVLIYPNPLNPKRYVVLNSGFTFREYDYLNNARQVPKLPDWAVVDITTPPNSRYPGRIASAGFFGERWEYVQPPTASTAGK